MLAYFFSMGSGPLPTARPTCPRFALCTCPPIAGGFPSRLASRGKGRPEAAQSAWGLLLGRWCPSRALLHPMLALAWAAGFTHVICNAALWNRAVDPDSGRRSAVHIPG